MKRIYSLAGLLLLILVVASCNKSTVKPNPGQGINLALNAVEQQNATADNAFTFNLFKTVQAGDNSGRNLFLSPLSVSIALGMVNNGANSATREAINSTLGFNSFSQDEVNGYFNKLITDLPKLDPNTTLNIANSIWYRQGFSVLPQFLKTDSDYFHAQVHSLDFGNPSSVKTINNWVNAQTNGKIPTIIEQIPSDDVMYLINAIYFKSIWDSRFDQAQTRTQAFYLPDQSTVQASFMKSKINYNFHYVENAAVLELPYVNKKFSMVIVMPNSTTSVNELVGSLDTAIWNNWMGRLSPVNSDVIMPKFKFSYGIVLNNDLIKLGMGNAFSPSADFTGINAGGGLSISKVQHRAFVAVDETGTEAAAATLVAVQLTDALNPPTITIDHPFLFVIREMKTGLILFAGIVNNPTQQ